jgi:hypothetical protein
MTLALTAGSVKTPPDTVPWLHIAVFDRVAGAGAFAAGWLADPAHAIATLTIATSTDAPTTNLLSEGIVPMTQDFLDAFGAPPGMVLPCAFLVRLPDVPPLGSGQVRLEVRYRNGSSEQHIVPAAGHFAEIARVFEIAAVDDALVLAERLLARRDGVFDAVPPPIAACMARLQRRMSGLPGIKTAVEEVISIDHCGMLLRLRLPLHDEPVNMMLGSFGGRRSMIETPLPAISAGQPDRQANNACAIFAAISDLRPDREQFWFLKTTFAAGRVESMPVRCPPSPPAVRGIEAVLALMAPLPRDPEAVLDRAVAPAITNFWRTVRGNRRVTAQAVYGGVDNAPQLSVIVPLGDQVDQMRHQLAQFSIDPDFRSGSGLELIYLADDISVNENLAKTARTLHEVYDVPFRTIVADCGADRASGCNLGAAAAAGGVLVFLGAEVLPKKAGWVSELLRSYESLADCGILGCRLLAEDGSIRHGGVKFHEAPNIPGGWEEHYPLVGLPSRLDPAGKARRVPAVSGACLMIKNALFRGLGGFSEDYVYGGFADLDLCFAAWRHGRRVYYTPEVELFWVGNATTAGLARLQEQLDLYNRWQYGRKWAKILPGLLAQCSD